MKQFGLFQLVSMTTGLLLGGWLLVVGVQDYLWANQPLVKLFYDFDQLRDRQRLDADGLFHDPVFDELKALPLTKARLRLEAAGFSCEPLLSSQNTTSCHYGYPTDTGCCRFRVVIDYGDKGVVENVRGDKVGQCGR